MKRFATLMFAPLLAAALAASAATPRTIEMTVDGLVCAFCAQGIDKKLRKQAAVQDVFVSLEHKIVAVSLKDGQDIEDRVLDELLTDAGYTLREVERTGRSLDALRQEYGSP